MRRGKLKRGEYIPYTKSSALKRPPISILYKNYFMSVHPGFVQPFLKRRPKIFTTSSFSSSHNFHLIQFCPSQHSSNKSVESLSPNFPARCSLFEVCDCFFFPLLYSDHDRSIWSDGMALILPPGNPAGRSRASETGVVIAVPRKELHELINFYLNEKYILMSQG